MPPATNAMIFCFLLTCLVVYYITERARLNGERERERERGDKDPYRGWFRFFWTALLEEEVFQACVFLTLFCVFPVHGLIKKQKKDD